MNPLPPRIVQQLPADSIRKPYYPLGAPVVNTDHPNPGRLHCELYQLPNRRIRIAEHLHQPICLLPVQHTVCGQQSQMLAAGQLQLRLLLTLQPVHHLEFPGAHMP